MFYNNDHSHYSKSRDDPDFDFKFKDESSDEDTVIQKVVANNDPWWKGGGLVSTIVSTVSSTIIIAVLTSATTFLYRIAEQGSVLNESLQKLTVQVDKLERSLTTMDDRIKQLELERCRNANPNDPYTQRNC